MFDAKLAPVFVIELTYKAALTEIDAHMTAHVLFLQKYVQGRQFPRLRAKGAA